MARLRTRTDELIGKADDIMKEVNCNELRGKKRRNEVSNWLQQVSSIKKHVENNFREQNRCWIGCMPNYYKRRKISKDSLILTEQVDELIGKGQFENGVTFEQLPLAATRLPATPIVGKTADLTLEEIMNCILSKEKRIIGVHGMGGVGKTTIMKVINNQLTESKHFDDIVWITVSRDLDMNKLQKKIAKKLVIRLEDDDDEEDAQKKIFNTLEQRKKFLLILDDMWEEFPLDKIGIPHPSEENGCKIVLTTRNESACGAMGAHKIKVQVLSEEESWELFKKNAGDVILSKDIEDIAKDVARECCHLPLAIITVGKAMCGVNNVRVWMNALKELQEANPEIKGMKDAFDLLKFSYTRLEDPIVKSCFLYCSLYPEDHEIPVEELIECWICEGLIDKRETREENMNKGHAVLDELLKVSMLESCRNYVDNVECVKMHDLIRDMAIRITEEESLLSMIKAGVQLKNPPIELPEDAERISLMQNDIEELLGRPKCSKLLTLFLRNNPLEIIPDSYFNHMCLLKVLDLSETNLKSLPESVSKLKNLRALSLSECERLEEVLSLSELEELRVLDLSGTKITELPRGMEATVKLQRLNLNETRELHVFSAGIIPRLFLLEELTMQRSRWQWSSTTTTEGGAGIEEIINSTQLTTLKIDFTDLCSFLHYVNVINSDKLQMMKNFDLSVPRSFVSGNFYKSVVEINGCDLIDEENTLLLPNNTRVLRIYDCQIRSLGHCTRSLNNSHKLYHCRIDACGKMEFLMADEEPLLPYLKELYISGMSDLLVLCKGIPSPNALKSLELLHVRGCPKLKYLLPTRLLQQLRRLKHIGVRHCKQMEEIIGEEEAMEIAINEDNNTMTLPKLQSLEVRFLPNLKGICSRALICDALETINVKFCPQLKKLPFSVRNLPCALKEIKVDSKEWWDALEWDDPQTKAHFEHFLTVYSNWL